MSAKRILLIESGHFIGGVIQHLFAQQAELSVIEVFPGSVQELVKAVELHRPDIVVLDDTLTPEYMAGLLRTMQTSEGLVVVMVSTESNDVSVYRKQQIQVQRKADLFAAL